MLKKTVRMRGRTSKRSKARVLKSTIRKVKKVQGVSLAVKKYVQRTLHKNVETKTLIPYVVNNYPIRAYGVAPNGPHQLTTFDLLTPLDGVIQGTNNGQRLGDTIKIRKLKVRGYINLDSSKADDATFLKNPMYVKLFVGRRKDSIADPNVTVIPGVSNAFDNILQNGPIPAAPQNLPSDMYRMINNDTYKIYATRFFKIGTAAPSNIPNDSAQYNNDFSFAKQFSIDLSKHIDLIRYNPGTTTIASNVGMYMWYFVCFANGSPVNTLTNAPLECHFDVNVTYEDA